MTEGVSAAFGAGGPRVLALALDEDEELCPKPESDLDFLNGFQGNFAIELYNNFQILQLLSVSTGNFDTTGELLDGSGGMIKRGDDEGWSGWMCLVVAMQTRIQCFGASGILGQCPNDQTITKISKDKRTFHSAHQRRPL